MQAAVKAPIVTIPAVILGNIALVYTYGQGGFQWLYSLEHCFGGLGAAVAGGIGHMQQGSMSDSTFAVLCMAISQMAAFATVRAVLVHVPVEETEGPGVSPALMDGVASSLRDPRQCARCNFGP
eukprot:374871-Amphidinium_carterae.1